jgi:hypothetical protein
VTLQKQYKDDVVVLGFRSTISPRSSRIRGEVPDELSGAGGRRPRKTFEVRTAAFQSPSSSAATQDREKQQGIRSSNNSTAKSNGFEARSLVV